MAIYARPINLDNVFARVNQKPIVINDYESFSEEHRQIIDGALKTTYDDSKISLIPSCEKGHLKGAYFKGVYCDKCHSYVTDPQDRIESNVWLKTLYDDYKFLNPEIWMLFRYTLSSSIDALRWLSDSQYNPPKKIPDYLIAIRNTFTDFKRDYRYMVNNFESIITFLLHHPTFKRGEKHARLLGVFNIYKKYKNDIYSNYLPLVNKRLIIVEKTTMGVYTDIGNSTIIDVVYSFMKAANERETMKDYMISKVMARTLSSMSEVYANYYRNFVGRKKGLARQHISGSRLHFTFRSVITSIAGPHKYNEIHAHFAIGPTAFRPHLLNILTKRMGIKYRVASKMLYSAVNMYIKEVDDAMKILIADAKERNGIGIPVLFGRNPSLFQGSIILVYITKFKTDVSDRSVSVSNLAIKSLNADFDGDETNFTLILDKFMEEKAKVFDSAYTIAGMNPYEIMGNLWLPDTTVATVMNFLRKDQETEHHGPLFDKLAKTKVHVS